MSALQSLFMFVETWLGKGSILAAYSNLVRHALGISLFLVPWTITASGVVSGCCIVIGTIMLNAYRSFLITNISNRLTNQGVKSQTGCSDWWLLEGCFGGVKSGSTTFVLVLFSFLQWITLLGSASVLFVFCGLSLSQTSSSLSSDALVNVRLYTSLCVGVVVALHPMVQFLRARLQQTTENMGCSSVCSVGLIMALPSIITVLVFVPIVLAYSTNQITTLDTSHFTDVHTDRIFLALALAMFVFGATPDDVTSTFGAFFKAISFYVVIILAGMTTLVVGIGFGVPVLLGIRTSICGSITLSVPTTGATYAFVRIFSTMLALTVLLFKHQMDPKLTSRLTTGEIACDVMFKMVFLMVAGAIAISVPILPGLAAIFGGTSSMVLTIIFPFAADILMRINEDAESTKENVSLLQKTEGSVKATRQKSALKWSVIIFNALVILGVMVVIGFCMAETSEYMRDVWKLKTTEATYCELKVAMNATTKI